MRTPVIALLLTALGIVDALPCNADELSDAVAALRSWQNRIVSIRVRTRITSEAATDVMLREAGIRTAVGVKDWVWEDSGRYRYERLSYNDGRLVSRQLSLADYKRAYQLSYPAEDPARETPARLLINENVRNRKGIKNGVIEEPLWILWAGNWLGERIASVASAELDSDGLLAFDGAAIGEDECTVRLDPRHGYLPRIATRQALRFQVDEFFEVEPGFWFPQNGSLAISIPNGDILHRWDVSQVDLNADLPESLFVPPRGGETYIVDQLTGRQYWQACKPPANLLAQKAATSTNSTQHSSHPAAIAATPPSTRNWSLWLSALGAMFIALGIWLGRRLRT
jgi:hypothetical protein